MSNFKHKKKDTLRIGDIIYVDTHLYLSRGEDDVVGGKATITNVSEKYGSLFLTTKEHPGHSYNWDVLKEKQKELKVEFGDRWAYEDPDDRPEFNRWN